MKKLQNFSFIALFIVAITSFEAKAQLHIASDTIIWNGSAYINKEVDSTATSISGVFTTYTTNQIEWTQIRTINDGTGTSRTINFSVTSTEGQWENLNEDGEFLYHIASKKGTGTLRIKNSGNVYTLYLSLVGQSGSNMSYDFEITSFQKK